MPNPISGQFIRLALPQPPHPASPGQNSNDFVAIRSSFGSPEEINDSRRTAPSKRILELMPLYEKPLYGIRREAVLCALVDQIAAADVILNQRLSRAAIGFLIR